MKQADLKHPAVQAMMQTFAGHLIPPEEQFVLDAGRPFNALPRPRQFFKPRQGKRWGFSDVQDAAQETGRLYCEGWAIGSQPFPEKPYHTCWLGSAEDDSAYVFPFDRSDDESMKLFGFSLTPMQLKILKDEWDWPMWRCNNAILHRISEPLLRRLIFGRSCLESGRLHLSKPELGRAGLRVIEGGLSSSPCNLTLFTER